MADAVSAYVRDAPIALALVDSSEFRVREASASFARFMGTSHRDIVGVPLPDALLDGAELRDALRLLVERGDPVSGLELRSRHGARGFVVTAWRSEDATGDDDLAVLAVEAGAEDELADRIRQVNEALLVRALEARDRAARAEAASRSKSIFLASISHELRTPLNSVVGYLELMIQGVPDELPESARQSAERARSAAWHLRDMIEQIITAARADAQDDEELEEVDLAAVAREVRDMVDRRAREKDVELRVSAEDEPTILARPRELRQILVNLVGNAVKFTDAGSVIVEVEDGDPVLLRVTDTGIGIPAEIQDRIFEQFWQADGSTTRTRDGLGIGLWVVGTLVDRLGGEISVRSQPGEGSTFEVRLPRGDDD